MDHGREAIGEVAGSGARLMGATGANGVMVLVVGAHVLVGGAIALSWLAEAVSPFLAWAFRIPALWLGFPSGTANAIHAIGPAPTLALFLLPFAVWARAILRGHNRLPRALRTYHRRIRKMRIKLLACAVAMAMAAAHSGLPVLLAKGYANPGTHPIGNAAAPKR